MQKIFKYLFVCLSLFFNATPAFAQKYPLQTLRVPPGFKIDLYAIGVPNARSMVLSPNGTLFVGTRTAGNVYAIQDEDKDNRADKVYVIARGLYAPNGVDFKDGSLYVAEINRVIRFDNIEEHLQDPPAPVVINDTFHNDQWHGWKVARFGPDGKFYVAVGAPCNTCVTDGFPYGKIMRMNADGKKLEDYALGIRNSVGFDWDPRTKQLWFTDNGRDELGDTVPPDELNYAPKKGMHFGFPYCHGQDILDPEFGKDKSCKKFTPPAQDLEAHAAALGMRFYTGDMFPPEYKNRIFIAEHGSWNRANKVGYRVMMVTVEKNKAVSYEEFAAGWKIGEKFWGRPVDVLNMPDGSLLVSDDHAGVIYRVSYAK
ncbi:MAG: sorbosone dehydrogenase [Omnitrophica WOR_2 bacterium GWA2_47_8]|nr:MAG: sorbosone dehydrogenase [Omnitrophica WOR_2 bacterium GWA2_47_8]